MIIGERLRKLRERNGLTQGEVERRTGLLRCYISRVEHGHTVPAVPTLEKMARGLEVPMARLFYDGGEPGEIPDDPNDRDAASLAWTSTGEGLRLVRKFRRLLSQIGEKDRQLLLVMAQEMAEANRGSTDRKRSKRPSNRRRK